MARRTLLSLLIPLLLATSAQAGYDPTALFPLELPDGSGSYNGPAWPKGNICLRPLNSLPLTRKVKQATWSLCYANEHAEAFKRLKPLARHGNATAQAALGFLYDHGFGVRRNTATALTWYRRAARNGDANAEYILGRHYESGQGVKKNETQAFALFTKAADHKLLQAAKHLGDMYLSGSGVRKDTAAAFKWYAMVAGRDANEFSYASDVDEDYGASAHTDLESRSQRALGKMYETGQGVVRSPIAAINWYALAAVSGGADHAGRAEFDLGQMFLRGTGVAQNHTVAALWFELSAYAAYADAQYRLAQMYESGDGVPKNLTKAVKWYSEAARRHVPKAQDKLDRLLSAGQGVPKDAKATQAALAQGVKAAMDRFALNRFKTAYPLVLPLAEKGDAVAQTVLGLLCEQNACDVTDQPAAMLKWLKAAAAQGNAFALYKLGEIHHDRGDSKAIELFEKAAEQGSPEAPRALGHAYESDNKAAAFKWYTRAAKQGDAEAQFELAVMDEVAVEMGKKKNLTPAFKWYVRAAKQGHVGGEGGLAEAYAKGKGVAKSPLDAVIWYTLNEVSSANAGGYDLGTLLRDDKKDVPGNDMLAALWFGRAADALGNGDAQYQLALMYEHGRGVRQDKAKAAAWYTKAAKDTEAIATADAQVRLANLLYRGDGMRKDLKAAFKWFSKAGEQDDAQGAFMVGQMYEKGEAVAADKAQAIKWYTVAAKDGSEDAKQALSRLQK
jgi:TPR repeat protein